MTDPIFKVNFKPTLHEQEELKKWMIAENKGSTVLVHNINFVINNAQTYTLATISTANNTIGFVTWDVFKRNAYISLAAIAVNYRKQGAGRHLITTLLNNFVNSGILNVRLECAPAESEIFWRRLNFQTLPYITGYANNNNPKLFKMVVVIQEPKCCPAPYIEIYKHGSIENKRWPLHYKLGTNELVHPIITPVSGDWLIRYVNIENIEHSEKIKNFRSGICFDDPFLIITSL